MRTILVTGAAGFIGSHTTEALLATGDRVVGLDNFNAYYSPARKRTNLREVESAAGSRLGNFSLVEGDVRDRELIANLFESHAFDAVVHLAAMPGVGPSVADPWLYNEVNLTGTLNLLDAAARRGKPNFVFASTSSAYGRTTRIPFVESDPSDRPLAPYPASKRAAELLGHTYFHLHGLDFTALRFFTVYGPRGRPDMLAFKAMENLFHRRPLALYREGQVRRDWTYVSDIVSGIVAATRVRLGYEIVNLGRGEPVLVADFVHALEACAGRRAEYQDGPLPDSDVETTFADVSKAARLLGYGPRVSVPDGVEEMVRWYLRHDQNQPGGSCP